MTFTTKNSSTAESIDAGSSATVIPLNATTAPTSSAFTAFVLEQIRCVKARAQITVNQAEMALTALSAGMITPEQAILILAECGLEIE